MTMEETDELISSLSWHLRYKSPLGQAAAEQGVD